MTLNPDFRSADDVYVPDIKNMCGWGYRAENESTRLLREKRKFEKIQRDLPKAFETREAKSMSPEMLKKWNDFQSSKGRGKDSFDWSLLDEFVTGKPLVWLPQIIGSCVASNTFRPYCTRQMYEIVLQGQPEEYMGRNEFGPQNFGFYAPFSYGMARKRADMRGGDGLYCAPMVETMVKDGVLSCNVPELFELTRKLKVNDDRDFPEPQSAAIYRQFGDHKHIDKLAPYADYRIVEAPMVTNVDQFIDLLKAGKPMFVCSMEAIHKVGTHADGFPIHKRNPRDQWAHNMSFQGGFYASDGNLYIRESNESWGANAIYNRPIEDIADSFKANRLTIAAIGEIESAKSAAPLAG